MTSGRACLICGEPGHYAKTCPLVAAAMPTSERARELERMLRARGVIAVEAQTTTPLRRFADAMAS